MTYTIDEIAQVIGAERKGTTEAKINWLLIDSRSLCFPEETLFFALKTEKNDGHKYIEELYRRGVRNFVVESLPIQGTKDCNFLMVKSPLVGGTPWAEKKASLPRSRYSMMTALLTWPIWSTSLKRICIGIVCIIQWQFYDCKITKKKSFAADMAFFLYFCTAKTDKPT